MICGSHPEIIVASTFNDNLIRVTGEESSIYLQLIGRTSSSSGAGVKAMTQGVAKGHRYSSFIISMNKTPNRHIILQDLLGML